MSGWRKSGTTSQASSSIAVMRRASGWRSATWLPRRAESRGVASVMPSGASQASKSSIAKAVSARLLARSASMPAPATTLAPACIAASDRIGGVPLRKRSAPVAGRYSDSMANGSA